MQKLLLFVPLLSLLPVPELIAAGLPDPMIHRVHNKFPPVKNISKRNIECPPEKIPSGDNCCDQCGPGYVKAADCTDSKKTICKKCEEGQEYMDVYNYLPKCRRCSSCDPAHGLEVEEPCTRFQNVKCRCQHGHFCNSSEPCHHCDQCTKCVDGIVVECTQISDTVCGKKQDLGLIIGSVISVVLLIVLTVVIIFILRKYCRKQTWMPKKPDTDEPREMEPFVYPDVDLMPHFSDIAEEMTLEQVMKFVRKQGLSTPVIEKATLDSIHDSSERKIMLLERWYQEKGIKDAYGTLMRSLRDLKMRAVADKIKEKMAPHVE